MQETVRDVSQQAANLKAAHRWWVVAIEGVIALAVGIPFAIAASIVVAYAQRAIALDDLGPLGAVERGIALFRARLGSSLALWLVSLVVTIGAGIAVVIGLLIVLIPLGIVGAGAYFAFNLTAPTFALWGLLGLILAVALVVAAAAINTYTAAFWTLGYLGVTDRYPPPPAAAAPPEPLPPAPLAPAP